ncbi:hypothetical protein MYX82_13090, partial [Acidobacteria bacterium AH-259-D05]|nr:hypothetical protein [Acidobacteria bacterium AH-259-D05]
HLKPLFPELSRFNSTTALQASALYAKLQPEIERVLETVVREDLAAGVVSSRSSIRATAWNIERGVHLRHIIGILREHPLLGESDIFLLTELDLGMARTKNRFVAQEIAQALELNYAFAPCYIALNKGSGLESQVPGENVQALHGNALFSRHPLREAHSIALPNGKDLMRGKEKRLGSQQAVIAIVEHPLGSLRVVSLHLDAHSSQKHRRLQMKIILDHLKTLSPSLPVLLGGDWNTSTYNSSRSLYSILGYCRRVLMGVHNVIENHYPYPDRWFERHLFRELERQGYHYHNLNEPGVCSLHYNVDDLAANHRMADWIPGWCFWFINWALQKNDGHCSIKLDWFAGKDIAPDLNHPPRVVGDVHPEGLVLSDHDPIVLDFMLTPSS